MPSRDWRNPRSVWRRATLDDLTPNAAPLVASALGATRAGAFDVGAACNGFLTGLALGRGQIEAGHAERVLVIGAEVLSRLLDPSERGTAALFADGAGAALVVAVDGLGAIGPIVLRTEVDADRCVHASQTERIIRMRGPQLFREAVERLCESTLEVVERAGLRLDEVARFVYHQANARILDAVGERLGLPHDRVAVCTDRFGNTSSATIPIELADAESSGLLRPGDRADRRLRRRLHLGCRPRALGGRPPDDRQARGATHPCRRR